MTKPQAFAGSLESNDILISITHTDAKENTIKLDSIVLQQYGPAILALIRENLARFELDHVHVHAQDKGALDCTISARMETAILRYKELAL